MKRKNNGIFKNVHLSCLECISVLDVCMPNGSEQTGDYKWAWFDAHPSDYGVICLALRSYEMP